MTIDAGQYDFIIVDTPPGLGPVARRVLEASQHVIVPLQCEPLALQTTPQMLRGIQSLIAANENLTLAGLLLTMYDEGSSISQRVAEHVRRNLPAGMVFDTVIPRTLGAVEAFAAGQPVVLRDPSDAAAQASSPRVSFARSNAGWSSMSANTSSWTPAVALTTPAVISLILLIAVIISGGGISNIMQDLINENPNLVTPYGAEGNLSAAYVSSFWILVGVGVVGAARREGQDQTGGGGCRIQGSNVHSRTV